MTNPREYPKDTSSIERGYSPIPPMPEEAPPAIGSWRSIFRNRNMLALWLSQVCEHIADGILYMTFVEFAARSELGGAFGTSMWMFWMAVPVLLTGHSVGVFIDRWDRRRTMIAVNASRGVIAALMGVTMVEGWSIVAFYALAACLSFVTQFFLPAKAALLPKVVSAGDLILANSISNSTMWIMILVSLAGGGVLVAEFNLGGATLVAVLVYLASAFFASRIRVAAAVPVADAMGPREALKELRMESAWGRMWSEVKEGFQVMAQVKGVAFVIRRSVITMVVVGTIFIEMVTLTQGVLTQHQTTMKGILALGYVVAALGTGVVLGPVLIGSVGKHWPRLAMVRWAFVGLGVSVVTLSFMDHLSMVLVLSPLMGMAFSILMIVSDTTLQADVPDRALGRIFAVTNMLRQMMFTVATMVVGALDKFVGSTVHHTRFGTWEQSVLLVTGALVVGYAAVSAVGHSSSRS